MAIRTSISGRLAAGLLACAAAFFGIAVASGPFGRPAGAQVFDDRYPFLEQRRLRQPPPSSLEQFPEGRSADFSRAPPPRPMDIPAPNNILVVGDAMADWLAYGLEDAFADTPEVGVIRRHRTNSGLIRYDTRPDSPEWPHVAREIIEAEKPAFIVMMIGLNDRQPIRERAAARPSSSTSEPADGKKADSKTMPPADGQPQQEPSDSEKPAIAAEETQRVLGSYEFRTERWEELYSARIDEVIAALKTRGVPVYWVGLPAVRGQRSTGEMSYLNDIFRARAERAGIMFVDVWDGFVDEGGRFTVQGPDFEGQTRRLRTNDGVFFTKAGARKLAHYVEREIRRGLTRAIPVALPEPEENLAQPSKPGVAARPLVGPVVPLSATVVQPEELLGGGIAKQSAGDPLAGRVLVRGEPPAAAPGRADDFVWPPRPPITEASGPLPAAPPPPPVAAAPRPAPAPERTAQGPGGPSGRASPGPGYAAQYPPYPQYPSQYGPPGYRQPPQNWRPPPPSPFGGIFGIFR